MTDRKLDNDEDEDDNDQLPLDMWLKRGERIGFPLVVMIMVFVGLWLVMSWVGGNVVKPMVDSHINVLNTVQDSLTAQTRIMEVFSHSIDGIEKQEQEMQRAALERQKLLELILEEQQKTTIAIDKLNQNMGRQ